MIISNSIMNFIRQINGLPMRSPIFPILAAIFMIFFEETLFSINNDNIVEPIHFWARYVDDIFCILSGTHRQLVIFLNHLNNINRNIQFTIETETNKAINFLDLNMGHYNNKREFDIYRKPITTDTSINSNSIVLFTGC